MGYRSEVAIVIYGNGPADETDEDMVSLKLKYDALYAEQTPGTRVDIDWILSTGGWIDNGFQIHAESIKWYDGDSFVEFFDKLIRFANDLELNTEIIVLGEEPDDNESDYTGPNVEYRLGINRSISFN